MHILGAHYVYAPVEQFQQTVVSYPHAEAAVIGARQQLH